ncbi:MAG: tripartite tricarboxylate transporter substrate binding protein [Gammaproteobacteria bacterium]|nr:tripartite tricarboxylate transporter substrate binding protein [Gammaproteobacteria bacterium]MDD9871072.1 tripartite tricarboxylate transporter substrate binding protein [Gammaproteobacteria bacterium]
MKRTAKSIDAGRRDFLIAGAGMTAMLAWPGGRPGAADFPSGPIEVVTHAGLGGGTDTTARMLLIRTRRNLKADAVVNPKTGGGGRVAMSYVKNRPADGHTVMAITPTHLFTMAQGRAPLGIDDIKGVVRSTDDPIVVMVRGDSPLRTMEDLVKAGRKTPVKWGTTQIGGVDHVAAATFGKEADTRIAVVPFEGGGEIVTNLMGGNIQAAGLNVTEAKDQLERGDFRALVSLTEKRISSLPDTPSAGEKGVNAFFSTVRGIVVLKGVPQERVQILEAAMLKAMKHKTYQGYLTGNGLDADSIAGSEVWDRQIRRMYADARRALLDLGMVKQ